MTVDSVLEFEQRRNEPTRYNRDLMVKTIQAMKKIDEIKTRRQQRFFDRRMAKAEAKKKKDVETELMTHSDLITDKKVKSYIEKKKEQKRQQLMAKYEKENAKKQGVMGKDIDMLDSEDEQMEDVAVEVIKTKKTAAKTKAIGKKK